MSEEIVAGDVIRLKSGGPAMTVASIGTTQLSDGLSVWCEWFDEKNNVQKETFSLIAVEKVASEPKAQQPRRRAPKIVKC